MGVSSVGTQICTNIYSCSCENTGGDRHWRPNFRLLEEKTKPDTDRRPSLSHHAKTAPACDALMAAKEKCTQHKQPALPRHTTLMQHNLYGQDLSQPPLFKFHYSCKAPCYSCCLSRALLQARRATTNRTHTNKTGTTPNLYYMLIDICFLDRKFNNNAQLPNTLLKTILNTDFYIALLRAIEERNRSIQICQNKLLKNENKLLSTLTPVSYMMLTIPCSRMANKGGLRPITRALADEMLTDMDLDSPPQNNKRGSASKEKSANKDKEKSAGKEKAAGSKSADKDRSKAYSREETLETHTQKRSRTSKTQGNPHCGSTSTPWRSWP